MSFMCISSTRKGEGVEKGDTDNSVENIDFRNTEISHPFNHSEMWLECFFVFYFIFIFC